ncbi:MAG: C1 family peptidase [Salinivirgaceae bacterium]|nr:C1 family peptidase [Salinivirgaceae bacterium]MDD4745815.1 C1 family peptidase [Salinivirgaceae bacterium]MDY0281249.1 C1 family peptidase [Salinivirgaceae bacterium]
MRNIASLFLLLVLPLWMLAQEETEKKQGYDFTPIKEVKVTSVKNQSRSGTCWSFATATFVESELLKMGKPELDLSEMFVVRKTYEEKADMYVRMHGSSNFGGGGAVNDVIDVIAKYGMMPEKAYTGLEYGEDIHVHGELDKLLKAYVDAVVSNPNRKLSSAWKKGFNGILDAYLGVVPDKFDYNGKLMTPKEFAATYVPINPDDYHYFSSFTHHPFYEKFILEVPDNWTYKRFVNLPLDELMRVIDNAINEGHSISWAADVSERGFSWKNGLAIVPETDIEEMSGSERLKWEAMTDAERKKQMFSFETPMPEKAITQEIRQEDFDNYKTTDDHGMQIVGIFKDQNGVKYYKVKNSWGTDNHKYEGYLFASESFVRYKTLSILVNKNVVPKEIKKKYDNK